MIRRSILLAALLAAACGGSSDPQSPEELGTLLGRDAMATVVLQYFSGITEPTSRLITTEEEWARVWTAIQTNVEPMPLRPEIDFSRDALVLVALGTSAGPTVQIEEVRRFERGVVAVAQVESYSERCLVLQAIGQPVHVVRITRPAGRTLLVERTHVIRDCN